MDNEKDLMGNEPQNTENEVVEEVTEEIAEEIVEETAEEVTEEVTEEALEEAVEEEITEEPVKVKKTLSKVYLCDECEAVCENIICPVCGKALTEEEAYVCKSQVAVLKAKKTTKNVITAVVAVAAIVAVIFAGLYVYRDIYNPYNHSEEYKDLAFGDTIEEVVKEYDMTVEEYLEARGLPKNMAKSTYENIATQFVPVAKAIEGSGMTAQEYIKDVIGLEGEFSEDVTTGEVEAQMTLKQIFGVETEEDLAEIKEYYGLDEEVTLETLFKDVRGKVYKSIYEKQQEEKAQTEAEEANAETETAETETAEADENTEEAK